MESVVLIRRSQLTCFFVFVGLLAVAASEESALQVVQKYSGSVKRDTQLPGKPVVAVDPNQSKIGARSSRPDESD